MSCKEITHRQKLQDQLLELNPGAAAAVQRMVRPPGHVICLPLTHNIRYTTVLNIGYIIYNIQYVLINI